MISDKAKHSQKLIRCVLLNQDNVATVRFVEYEVFNLWRYMMTNKYGFTISEMSLCMWISEGQYIQKEDVYARSGDIEPVSRIVFTIFDPRNGFSHTTSRFVLEPETEEVRSILVSHIPDKILSSEFVEVDTYPGVSIETSKISELDEVILGLSCEQNTQWIGALSPQH